MRKEVIGACELYLGDCREVLPMLDKIDAVVTDPPYGIGYDPSQYKGNFSVCIHGDDKPFDPTPILALGATKIIWGANNFAASLPPGGWLCWDKRCSAAADKILGSPFELAWTSDPKKFRMARILHAGKLNADGNDARREHPTQKPVALMIWCIEQLPPSASIILDPYMGSGTTGVAAVKLGRRFVGVEIEPRYFDIARKRIEEAMRQLDMFIEQPKPAAQLGFAELET